MADTYSPQSHEDQGANAVGWVLALVVALAVIAVAVFWYRNGTPAVPNTGTDTNAEMNSELPSSGSGAGSGSEIDY